MADNAIGVVYKFQDCLSEEVSTIEFEEGTLLFCRDSGECFYDAIGGTDENDRVPVGKTVRTFETEAERRTLLYPESGIIYVVKENNKIYIYNGGWVCLNADTPFYFDIEGVVVPIGTTGATVNDDRIEATCTGEFKPIASVADLFGGATVTCSDGSATIVLNNTFYDMIGVLKISGYK